MMRYFHDHLDSAELSIRAWVLAQNFLPYCSRIAQYKSFSSRESNKKRVLLHP